MSSIAIHPIIHWRRVCVHKEFLSWFQHLSPHHVSNRSFGCCGHHTHVLWKGHLANAQRSHVVDGSQVLQVRRWHQRKVPQIHQGTCTLTLLYNGYLSVWSNMLSTEMCSKIQWHSAGKGLWLLILYMKSNARAPFILF